MYTVIEFKDKEKWQMVIEKFKRSDIYFQWGYVKGFKVHGDGEPFLFLYEDESGIVANVFFLRDISLSQGVRNKIQSNMYFDISSVYGYGGPLYEGVNIEKLVFNYNESFNKYCIENNIISEVIRFNPLLQNHKALVGLYDVVPVRKTIYVDLSKGEEYIWSNLKSENRTRIRKAIKSGVKVLKGRDEKFIKKFMELYFQTMDRDQATQYYYFKEEFFKTTFEDMSENALIFAAEYQNKIISACLVLFNNEYIHYHLGGSNQEYMNLAPNNLLFYEVSKWASGKGIKKFHLGGGYSNSNDNLFRFKRSFSKLEPLDFYIGKKVYNENLYNWLVEIRRENDTDFNDLNEYFPKYRG